MYQIKIRINKWNFKFTTDQIKSFFSGIWNWKANKTRRKLYQDIANWYPSNVTQVRLMHLQELRMERAKKRSLKVMYRCPSCVKTFMDYRTVSDASIVECNKCLGLEKTVWSENGPILVKIINE